MPGLSIVVPAHNSGPRLRETLQQLVRELGRDDVEVIIVENGSSDNTWEIAGDLARGSWGFPVRAFQSEVGLGAAYLKGPRKRGERWFFSPPTTSRSVSRTSVPGSRSVIRRPW